MLVDHNGRCKLADFGLSHIKTHDDPDRVAFYGKCVVFFGCCWWLLLVVVVCVFGGEWV